MLARQALAIVVSLTAASATCAEGSGTVPVQATLWVQPSPSTVSDTVNVYPQFQGTPGIPLTGTWEFRRNGVVYATFDRHVQWNWLPFELQPGSHGFTVHYSGDDYYAAVTTPAWTHLVFAVAGEYDLFIDGFEAR